jgi:hypothetical protein
VVVAGQLRIIGRGDTPHPGQHCHGIQNTLLQHRNLLLRIAREQRIDVERNQMRGVEPSVNLPQVLHGAHEEA